MASKNIVTMKTRYGAMAAATIPLIIMGGAYMAFSYFNRRRFWRRENLRVRKRSVSIAAWHGGKVALQRLVDYEEARADVQNLSAVESELNVLLGLDNLDFSSMKRIVAKLEMSGNEAKAVQILQKEKSKALDGGKYHEAYDIEMLLVELLIYKGEFERAFYCNCLTEEKITDARRPLFKAIALVAIKRDRYEELAKQYWENFKDIREDFSDPPSFKETLQEILEGNTVYKLATSFDEFKKIVERLKDDIDKAHSKKKKL